MKTTGLKQALLFALALCACAAVTPWDAAAQAKRSPRPGERAPRFEDYPAREVYKGPAAPVRLDSRKARMFRTRLREDSRSAPNFAGRYVVVVWGCGTGCAQMGVVDSKTGRVYFPPLEYVDIPDVENEATRGFRRDSRLLVLTRNHYDGRGSYTAFYYLFDGGRFRLLRRAKEQAPPPADETEDENQEPTP
jgi:hypothetical protein